MSFDVMPSAAGVYRIVNTINGNCYVGSSRDIRKRIIVHLSALRNGSHHARHLMHAWKKYGVGAFVCEVLELVIDDPVLLAAREQFHIDKLRPRYNTLKLAYSPRGHVASIETRKKISAAGIGRKHSAESRAKISAANRGRKLSNEQMVRYRAVCAARRGKPGRRQSEAEMARRRGRKHTVEAMAKMKAACRVREAIKVDQQVDDELRRSIQRVKRCFGMSQKKLSKEIGIAHSRLSDLVTGARSIGRMYPPSRKRIDDWLNMNDPVRRYLPRSA
jgi:group I intron endonuclease